MNRHEPIGSGVRAAPARAAPAVGAAEKTAVVTTFMTVETGGPAAMRAAQRVAAQTGK
jgi:hypothetical protein